jgi:hypothetical protein
MLVAVGKQTRPSDLRALIDRKCVYDLDVRAGKNKGIDVDHRFAVLREEAWPATLATNSRVAYDLALRVDAIRGAARPRVYHSEIGHHAVLPEKCVVICAL